MSRYVALAWDCRSLEQRELAVSVQRRLHGKALWELALQQPSLVVFRSRQRASDANVNSSQQLTSATNVILGDFFQHSSESTSQRAYQAFDAENAERLRESRGQSILKMGWGSYVLFVSDRLRSASYVFRGPMTNLGCFWCRFKELYIFFSDPEDCIALGILRFSVNWDSIRTQAVGGDYLGHQTAINEIRSIEPGECFQVQHSEATTRVYWTPRAVAMEPSSDNFVEAAESLRAATLSCAGSWARGHDGILHTLSGGIDSSIVLSAVTQAAPQTAVTCITQYSRHPVGDERSFARLMADRARTRLIERERNHDFRMEHYLSCRRTAHPMLSFTDAEAYPTNVRLAEEIGATAIFNGEPGDNVFGSVCDHEFVTEFAFRRGLRPQLLEVAMDYAQLRGQLVWSALYRALRDWMFSPHTLHWSVHQKIRSLNTKWPFEHRLITVEAARQYDREPSRFLHPWLRDTNGMPPGKYLLVYALPSVCSFDSPFSRPGDPQIIAPLASQPLIEWALRIPSYLNMKDGVDRSIARYAFQHDLPGAILTRDGKGGPDMWTRHVVAQNKNFLNDILGQGMLVKERIVDGARLSAFMSQDLSGTAASPTNVIPLLYIEAWLRRWTAQTASLSACNFVADFSLTCTT